MSGNIKQPSEMSRDELEHYVEGAEHLFERILLRLDTLVDRWDDMSEEERRQAAREALGTAIIDLRPFNDEVRGLLRELCGLLRDPPTEGEDA